MREARSGYPLVSATQFGAYLRSLRKSQGLTQRELGKQIGVSGARISEIEHDPGALGLTQLLKLLHALGARVVLDIEKKKGDATTSRKAPMPAGEW